MWSPRKRKQCVSTNDAQATVSGVKYQCLNGISGSDSHISPSASSSVFTNVIRELCDDSSKSESCVNVREDAGQESSGRRSLHCVKVFKSCCSGSGPLLTTAENLPPAAGLTSKLHSGRTQSIAMAEQFSFDPTYEIDDASVHVRQNEVDLVEVKSEADDPPVEPDLISLTTEGGSQVQITNTRKDDLPVTCQLEVQPYSQSAELSIYGPVQPIADPVNANHLRAPLLSKKGHNTQHNGIPLESQPTCNCNNKESADLTDEMDVTDGTDGILSEAEDEVSRQLKIIKAAKLKLGNIRKARAASAHHGCCMHCDSNKQMLTGMCSLMQVIHDHQDQIVRRFDKLERNIAQLQRTVSEIRSPHTVRDAMDSASPSPFIPQVLPCSVGVGVSKSVINIGAHREECDFTEEECIIPDSVVSMVEEKSEGNIQVFASTLTMALYGVEELQGRAVDGSKQGKAPLSPRRLGAIKKKAFEVHSVPYSEQRDKWHRCKNAINCKLRNLFRKW